MALTPAQLADAASVAALIAPLIPAPGSPNRVSNLYLRQQTNIYSATRIRNGVDYIRDNVAVYPFPISWDNRGYHFYLEPDRYLAWSAPRNKIVATYQQRTYSEAEKLLLIAVGLGDPNAQFILNQMTQQAQQSRQTQDNLNQYLTQVFPNLVTV